MTSRSRIFLLVLAVCAWCGAGRLNRDLARQRAEPAAGAGPAIEGASPLVAFTAVALGGFRGLLADLLWLRVSRLQDEGQFFEVFQLSEWITKLEPRATEVWAFHAWNMAYNISVMMTNADERWRWVRNGLKLLRDDGLRWNPDDPLLQCEIAWLFQFKIGGRTDEAAPEYRRRWAGEMTALLGGGRPDYARLEADPARWPRMRQDYGLVPAVMREVEAAYGPLDWRLPETHAVYWAFLARQHAPGGKLIQADRIVFQSLAALVLYEPGSGGAPRRTAPDLWLLPRLLDAYRSAWRRYPDDPTIPNAFANFLRAAAQLLNRTGHPERVQELYGVLLKEVRPPDAPPSLAAWLAEDNADARH